MALRDSQIDLCGQTGFARTAPLLAPGAPLSFACRGCGDCCRGREDIVLSGYDLWRIAGRLRLPPQVVARGFCRGSIGRVSRLPVLRLAPVRSARNNCPFLSGNRCAIHEAAPLVCALYPLAQEIDRTGAVRYFLQPVECGGPRAEAKLEDYLDRYGLLRREPVDRRWALACMALEDKVEALAGQLEPVLARRLEAKLWQALYYGYNPARPYLPQLEENLVWLAGQMQKLREFQDRRRSIEKNDGSISNHQ